MTELQPGDNEILCELTVEQPGEFSSQLHLYVDDGGTRQIVLAIHGIASAPKGNSTKDK